MDLPFASLVNYEYLAKSCHSRFAFLIRCGVKKKFWKRSSETSSIGRRLVPKGSVKLAPQKATKGQKRAETMDDKIPLLNHKEAVQSTCCTVLGATAGCEFPAFIR